MNQPPDHEIGLTPHYLAVTGPRCNCLKYFSGLANDLRGDHTISTALAQAIISALG